MDQITPADPSIAFGQLLEKQDDSIVLGLGGTDYRLHLLVRAPVAGDLNKPIRGRILARARRVDRSSSGGRFIEPVYGRPRRLQGAVVATDPKDNTITVMCSCPFVCTLTTDQQATEFHECSLVMFDIERGAQFEPV